MPRVSPRHLLLAVLLIASVLFLLYVLRRAQPEQAGRDISAIPAAQSRDLLRIGAGLDSAAPSETDFSRYAALARTNVFSERRTQPPPPKREPKPLPSPPPLPGGDKDKPTSPKIDFSAWTYAGYVALDGVELGIVQNDTTHTCEYLAVGDEFMGAVVTSVDRDSMKLKAGASRTTLSRTRDFSTTPLAKAATTQPERPGPRPGR